MTDPITSASSPSSPIAEPTDNLVTEPVKPRWAGFEPLDNPHLRIKIKPPRTNPLPPGHWFVAAVFIAVSAAYIAGCAYYAYIKHQGVGLLQRAEAGGPVKPAEVIAWLDHAHRAYYGSLLCFVLIFFGCFVWMRFLHRRVGRDFMARSPAAALHAKAAERAQPPGQNTIEL